MLDNAAGRVILKVFRRRRSVSNYSPDWLSGLFYLCSLRQTWRARLQPCRRPSDPKN